MGPTARPRLATAPKITDMLSDRAHDEPTIPPRRCRAIFLQGFTQTQEIEILAAGGDRATNFVRRAGGEVAWAGAACGIAQGAVGAVRGRGAMCARDAMAVLILAFSVAQLADAALQPAPRAAAAPATGSCSPQRLRGGFEAGIQLKPANLGTPNSWSGQNVGEFGPASISRAASNGGGFRRCQDALAERSDCNCLCSLGSMTVRASVGLGFIHGRMCLWAAVGRPEGEALEIFAR